MRFRVLGPVRMEPRTPSAAKPRTVLAVLLVQSGSVVPTHSLIDELWGSRPPRTAATTLQVYISQLRKALRTDPGSAGPEPQPLVTRPPGYLLQTGPEDLDLTLFEALRARGRAAYARRADTDASRFFAEALGLWTGPALAGIPHGPMLEGNAIRLEELRTEVLEQRISADLRLGRHQELVGELMALVREHPLREALQCHLMLALFRCGRQSDALRAYQGARRVLVEELGVEPGPELRRLHKRVLASDPTLGPAMPTADQGRARPARPGAGRAGGTQPAHWLPSAVTDFVGRRAELAKAGTALRRPAAGSRRVLVVAGRAGVGKTAFAIRLAHELTERFPDGRVLLTLRDAGGRAMPPAGVFGALLRRLGDDGPRGPRPDGARGAPPEGARGARRPGEQRGGRRPEEGGGVLVPGGGRPARPGPGAARPLPGSLDELSELLHQATRNRLMLVVLDDAVSEAQVRPVLDAAPDTAFVITGRPVLGALEDVRHLVLDSLPPDEAERLLRACGGARMAQDQAAAAEIARRCGYLPLALRVAAAGLATRPHWTAAVLAKTLADERTRLGALALGDLDVRSTLLTGYQQTPGAHRRAFRLLALAPQPDFPLWVAAALLGAAQDEAEDAVEELVRVRLLEAGRAREGGGVRYGFHALLRSLAVEVLAEEPERELRAATERLCRAYLRRARIADALLTPGRDPLAGVADAGVREPDDETVEAAPLAWFRAESPGLLEAVRLAHGAGLWDLAAALASSAAGYFEAYAAWDEWQSSHDTALDAARRAGDERAEAAVLRSLGDLAWQRRDSGRAVDCYRLAGHVYERLGDRGGAGRCHTGEADVLLGLGRLAEAERGFGRALAAARAASDARGRAEAARGLAFTELSRRRLDPGLGWLAECGTAAVEAGDRRWQRYAARASEAARTGGADSTGVLEVRPGVWLMRAGL
ncbi:BTAD domain-containing putative transcriptional regulator [Streptomyces sp. NPDC050560]|uniref:AfsR/SARP family transcriptional regulator n=1 Tax=Streptomyces sp. NPDC050560 TaxID=3365630 RepID=UPI00378E03D1